MTPAQLALRRVEARLLDRLERLERQLDQGDDEVWRGYCEVAGALAAIARETAPGAGGRLMTTRELADQLGVSTKTVLRKRRAGQLEAVLLGHRGRAALRWPGQEALGR